MNTADRLALILRVLRTAHDGTDSWEKDYIGVQLAYLAFAIADETKPFAQVDWSREVADHAVAVIRWRFKQWFPADAPVWGFIRL